MISEILHGVGALALDVIDALGLPGVFLLMVAESMVLPVPSEAVMPFAGFLASDGRMSYWGALAAGTLGTLVGSLLSYAMGRYGARPFLERWGRYVLVTPHHIEQTDRFFEKRHAAWGIFLSRFVPVVRHLISIPAGGARMPLVPFCTATVAGGLGWNWILLHAGFVLGENWETVERVYGESRVLILGGVGVLLVGGVAWWLLRRRARKVVG